VENHKGVHTDHRQYLDTMRFVRRYQTLLIPFCTKSVLFRVRISLANLKICISGTIQEDQKHSLSLFVHLVSCAIAKKASESELRVETKYKILLEATGEHHKQSNRLCNACRILLVDSNPI
jgi:hypothetical protein